MRHYDNIGLARKENAVFRWTDLCKAYWQLLGSYKWKWLALALLLFVVSFYSLVPPLIIGKMVDLFGDIGSGNTLKQYYILALVLGVSYIVISYARLTLKYWLGNIQREVSYLTKVKGFEKLLDFSYSWHSNESAGSKVQRIKNGVDAYKALNHKVNNEIMRMITKMIGVIAVFLFLQPKYVVFFLVYTAGFWTLLLFFQGKIQRRNDDYYRSLEKAGGTYVEGLNNILTIKTLGVGGDFKDHIATKEHDTKDYEYSIATLHNQLWKTHQIFNGVCYGLFLFLVGHDVVLGTISAGYLVIFYGYLNDLISSSGDMIETYQVTLDAKSGLGRLMGIFWAAHTDLKGTLEFPHQWKSIDVVDASFTYKNVSSSQHSNGMQSATTLPSTVQNISFSIARGEKIGVVGRTGSGKSTLAKILTGLYRLDSGVYTVGGVPFDEISHEEQTRELTLVLQESEIFNLTLRENIALMKNLDQSVIDNAVRIAQLEEVVTKLPQGLDTLVGEKGYHLSGGERQRVGIARAICKDASILIFDEATSSLDSKTEYHIQEALDNELKEKTIITIAHRVSTLKNTDRIFVFDNGEIVEVGTYDELSANKRSKFYELYSTQEKK